MTDIQPELKTTSLNFKKYLIIILSNWYWFFISLAVCYSIAYLVNRYTEPVYFVSSALLVQEEAASPTSIENIIRDLGFYKRKRKSDILNEIEILKSYEINYRAITELDFSVTYALVGRRGITEIKLYKNSPIKVSIDTSKYNRAGLPVYISILSESEYQIEYEDEEKYSAKLSFGQPFENDLFNFTIHLNPAYNNNSIGKDSKNYYFLINDQNKLANIYRNKLDVIVNDEKGSILLLSTRGFNKQQEVDYLNKLAEVYIRVELEEKNSIAENSILFIEDQLKNISDTLIIDEEKLQNFRLDNSILGLSEEAERLMQIQQEIQREKVQLLIEQNYYEYLSNYLDTANKKLDIVLPTINYITTSDLYKQIEQLNKLYIDKELLTRSATNENIIFENLEIEIENVKALIRKIITENNRLIADRLKAIIEREENLNNNIQTLPLLEREYLNIERRFTLYDNLYNFLLQKRAEAGIAKASNISSRKVIDKARVENVTLLSPNRRANKLIALALGIMIPFAFILLINLLKNKIDDLEEIGELSTVPIIAVIGHNPDNQKLPVLDDPKSYLTESFRSLRTNLKYLIKKDDNFTITITSTVSNEGKTFCSVNLAAILALAGNKTLIVELDLRRPNIYKLFGLDKDEGISNYLAGLTDIDEIIYPTQTEHLYVTPGGSIPPNPSELIDSQALTDFFAKVKNEFDYVIVDTPPIAFVSDAIQLSKISDAHFFVIRHKYSNKNVITYINKLYQENKLSQINILVNDVKTRNLYGYGYYGFPYSYGYSMGYYNKYYGSDGEENGFFKRIFGRKG